MEWASIKRVQTSELTSRSESRSSRDQRKRHTCKRNRSELQSTLFSTTHLNNAKTKQNVINQPKKKLDQAIAAAPLRHTQDILCRHLLHCTLCILVQCNPIPASNNSSKLQSVLALNTHYLSKKLLLSSCANTANKMEETVALVACK
jgi:hypothetical protein